MRTRLPRRGENLTDYDAMRCTEEIADAYGEMGEVARVGEVVVETGLNVNPVEGVRQVITGEGVNGEELSWFGERGLAAVGMAAAPLVKAGKVVRVISHADEALAATRVRRGVKALVEGVERSDDLSHASAGVRRGVAGADHLHDVSRGAKATGEAIVRGADDVPVRGPSNAIHKNSLEYVGDTHVYRIREPDGTTFKIGESAQGVRIADGASIRAEQQVRALNRTVGPGHTSEIRRWFQDKASAREYETRLIERFRRMFGKDALPGNKTNR